MAGRERDILLKGRKKSDRIGATSKLAEFDHFEALYTYYVHGAYAGYYTR